MARFQRQGLVAALFIGLTIVITIPQISNLQSVPYHSDPYFSMWRLGWVAHQIRTQPSALFQANIFFPSPDTLAYSDAMLLPGVVLAPLFWLHVSPPVIYNLALLGGMLLSAIAAFWLAFELTGNTGAAAAAGTIYAFAPYRFDHYFHLELQLVFWIPVALLMIHRLLAAPTLRLGILLALVVLGQTFSCVYAVIFFAAYCLVFIPVAMANADARGATKAAMKPLAIAVVLILVVASPYFAAYARASRTVGIRTPDDVAHYGATLASYTAAPSINRLYGSRTSDRSADELYLFPGIVAVACALVGVVAPTSRTRFAYLAALLLAVELSRGLDGVLYGWLYDHLAPFRGLRSPARIGILVNLSLAMLSAYGLSWLLPRLRRRSTVAATLIVAALAAEYASAPPLSAVPSPTLVDTWLSRQAPAVIVELPLASPDTFDQSRDWLYMYQGLGHFQRMLNGYSGYPPASYYAMLESMRGFPDQRSIEFLRNQHVDYVVLRAGGYADGRWTELTAQVEAAAGLVAVSGFPEGGRTELVYAVRR